MGGWVGHDTLQVGPRSCDGNSNSAPHQAAPPPSLPRTQQPQRPEHRRRHPPEASCVTGMPITPNICFTPRRASALATRKHPLLGSCWRSTEAGLPAGAAPPPPAGRQGSGQQALGWY